MSDIELKIDELYRLPLGEFTAARNALAKMLKGADAARVKVLTKPAVVPWAVNQLYWHRRPAYDRLLAAGHALRDAQIAALGGRSADVGRASDAHRKALADAVRDALSVASAHGIKAAGDQLARMLEMLSLRPAGDEPPGRWTDLIQASGLEALAGITLAPDVDDAEGPPTPASMGRRLSIVPATRGARRSSANVVDADAERCRAEEVAAARQRAGEQLEAAERAFERTREAEEAAQRDIARAEETLEQAQRTLETARRDRRAASDALNAARRGVG